MEHVLIFIVWFSVLFGWTANRKLKGECVGRKHKEEWVFANIIGFYLYGQMHAYLSNVYIAITSIIIGSLFNYALIEYFWNRHDKVVTTISKSLAFKFLSLIGTAVIASYSVLYSGLVIEEMTNVPSSAMTNYVAVFSLIMLAIFLPLALILLIEIIAPIVILVLGVFNRDAMENKIIVIMTLLMSLVPLFTITYHTQFTMLNTKFFQSLLYDTYHKNSSKVEGGGILKDEAGSVILKCNNLEVAHRFIPISATEVSTVKYVDEDGGYYHFDIDKCENSEK
ncbi:hypothetical protein ACED66_01450 [Vibrio splendidus]|uniref:hypothetical protein n=1 Tax=Vibrio splendidus TaxID=29497 RepID=UPI000D3DA821|nr:hypothetical protein [Vibrio splendidus]PTQ06997.1 hypothetical protein CWO28_09360 [Vibrio splendidus]